MAERVGPTSPDTDLLPGKQEKESDREWAGCLSRKTKQREIHDVVIFFSLFFNWSEAEAVLFVTTFNFIKNNKATDEMDFTLLMHYLV